MMIICKISIEHRDVDGDGDDSGRFTQTLLVLSSASSGLFFSSYTYFAISLTKVLEMLTSDHMTVSRTTGQRFIIILLGMYYVSITV
jgi:hypothetical protein